MLDPEIAARIEARLHALPIPDIDGRVGNPDVGAGILHDFLHANVQGGALILVLLGESALARVREVFALDRMTDATLAIYRDCLQEGVA